MPGKLLCSILTDLIAGGLLLVLMPSPRQWQLTSTVQNDTVDGSPANRNVTACRAIPIMADVYNRVLNSISHNQLTLGSGMITNQRDYVLVNKYVVNDTGQIIVVLQDGHAFEVPLAGSDTLTDPVVLKANATGGLPVAPINLKHMPHVGDAILAIGSPYNPRQIIIQGVISITGHIGLNPIGRQNSLQINTPANHGNSGRMLVNSLGELIGINTFSLDRSNDDETPESIGFAISFQLTTRIMDKLIRDGRVIRGYVDISGREIAPPHAQGGGTDQIQGIMVSDAVPDGFVAQAGIHADDVIVSVNGKPAVSALETMDQVAETRPGSEIPVVVMRGDKKITLHIAVQGYPVTN